MTLRVIIGTSPAREYQYPCVSCLTVRLAWDLSSWITSGVVKPWGHFRQLVDQYAGLLIIVTSKSVLYYYPKVKGLITDSD